MPVIEHGLNELLSDAYAFCFNYHLDGWQYRVKTEGFAAVQKDCDESAKNFINQLKKYLKETK